MNVTDVLRFVPVLTLGAIALGEVKVTLAEAQSGRDFVAETCALLASEVASRNPALVTDAQMQALLVDEVLRPRFDLARSSEIILREYWRDASPTMRNEFELTFYRYLVSTYANAIHWFTDETVVIKPGEEPEFRNNHRVATVLTLHDGQTYEVQFYLGHRGDRWYVIDVIVDGVSYARTYSSDFRAIVRQDGLDGLLAWLAESGQRRAPVRQ